jgi:transposase
MSEARLVGERERAIHLLRSGYRVKEVASALGRSVSWVKKWRRRHASEAPDNATDGASRSADTERAGSGPR